MHSFANWTLFFFFCVFCYWHEHFPIIQKKKLPTLIMDWEWCDCGFSLVGSVLCNQCFVITNNMYVNFVFWLFDDLLNFAYQRCSCLCAKLFCLEI